MANKHDTTKNVIRFWKMVEWLTPKEAPKIQKEYITKQNGSFPMDVAFTDFHRRDAGVPYEHYDAINEYIQSKKANVKEGELYNRVNIYYGDCLARAFLEKMYETCGFKDDSTLVDLQEISDRFFLFCVQVDLKGNLTEDEGFTISPFFYILQESIKRKRLDYELTQNVINSFNEDINKQLRDDKTVIKSVKDIDNIFKTVSKILKAENLFTELGITDNNKCICKGLTGDERSDDINSYFLSDLELVESNYFENHLISRYANALLDKNKKQWIDTDPQIIKKWIDAKKFPLAKYPTQYSPSFMQQLAINIALSGESESEIFSVNGPPGTGKTTLLKEIVAGKAVELADKLINYDPNTDTQFNRVDIASTTGTDFQDYYYQIPDELASCGLIVASQNNAAVENVTLNLPIYSELEDGKPLTGLFFRENNNDVYFSVLADLVLQDSKAASKELKVEEDSKAWGLISLRAGRKQYVKNAVQRCRFRKKDEEGFFLNSIDSISFEEAKANYKKQREYVKSLQDEISKDQHDKDMINKLKADFKTLTDKTLLAEKEVDNCRERCNKTLLVIENITQQVSSLEMSVGALKRSATLFQKILAWFGFGQFYINLCGLNEQIKERYEEKANQESTLGKQQVEMVAAEHTARELRNKTKRVEESVTILEQKVEAIKVKYKNNFVNDDDLKILKKTKDIQLKSPWTYKEYDKAREELFYHALQVRKAFILSSKYIRRNMFVFDSYCDDKYTPSERREMFGDLLNTLLLIVPIISTTFASVGRFLRNAGSRSFGTLIVDEAGQAVPYYALGAIYRAKRTLIVGDPLQIPPVMSTPRSVLKMLTNSIGLDEKYASPDLSVQEFADLVNPYGGKIGDREVGCPLTIHRRCEEPMFSISNNISYNNTMFSEAKRSEKNRFIFEGSGLMSVSGKEKGHKDHFVKEQGEEVIKIVKRAIELYGEEFYTSRDKLYVIAPFRTVVAGLKSHVTSRLPKAKAWAESSIGTVHTFQGKEADEVVLVLGCSAGSDGAMDWAVKTPNLFNVACTRAKRRFVVICDYDIWKNRKIIKDIVPKMLPIIECPP